MIGKHRFIQAGLIKACFLLALSPVIATAVQLDKVDDLALIAIEGNAEVDLVLISRSAPANILARATSNPVAGSVSDVPPELGVPEAALDSMGHPGNIKFGKHSYALLFANGVKRLNQSMKAAHPDFDSDKGITLSAVYVALAGYDAVIEGKDSVTFTSDDGDEKTMDKPAYFKMRAMQALSFFKMPLSASGIWHLTNDNRLLYRMAMQQPGTSEERQNFDYVQLTTFAQAYKVRNGEEVPLSGRAYDIRGGTLKFGEFLIKDYLTALPADCSADEFDRVKQQDEYKIPLFHLLNQAPVAKAFVQVKLLEALNDPKKEVGFTIPGLPQRKHHTYLGRVSQGMKTEAGSLGMSVMEADRKSLEVDDTTYEAGMELLNQCAGETIIPGIISAVSQVSHAQPGRYSDNGELYPLIFLGESHLIDGKALRPLRDKVTAGIDLEDQKRAIWVSPAEQGIYMGIAGEKILREKFGDERTEL